MIDVIKAVGRSSVTGIFVVCLGFLVWNAILALDTLSFVVQVSRHTHDKEFHASTLLRHEAAVLFVYSICFFAASIAVTRWRRDTRAGLKGAIIYLVYLAAYLPSLDWSRGRGLELITILTPLIVCPLSALSTAIFNRKPERDPTSVTPA